MVLEIVERINYNYPCKIIFVNITYLFEKMKLEYYSCGDSVGLLNFAATCAHLKILVFLSLFRRKLNYR